jgi:hypothetical protein
MNKPTPDASAAAGSTLAAGSPKIVCICGSTRFVDVMAVWAWDEEKKGHIALACHLLPHWYGAQAHHQAEEEGVAEILDALHLRKIDMADEVLVCNLDGYVGDRTRIETEYAMRKGKPIRWYEPDSVPSWANKVDNNPGRA